MDEESHLAWLVLVLLADLVVLDAASAEVVPPVAIAPEEEDADTELVATVEAR